MNELETSNQTTRAQIRSGELTGSTAGLCPGFLQTNIVILPASFAEEFIEFCQRNPKPCPLLAVGEPGAIDMPALGSGLDIRTDLPGYTLYRSGQLEQNVTDITGFWQQDFVTFALGCSFTFEEALMKAGIPMRHIEQGKTVSMFKTDVDIVPTATFQGKLVVSMRPIPKRCLSTVKAICSKFPHAHGAPVHWGNSEDLGIRNLNNPDWGDAVPINPDEVAVFWACGVTSQVALQTPELPFVITHKPGSMLITDVRSNCTMNVIGLG
tara:strand:+ start:118 stop:918 length:801 start_codon:yes stop_codon:yes gene_type:complete